MEAVQKLDIKGQLAEAVVQYDQKYGENMLSDILDDLRAGSDKANRDEILATFSQLPDVVESYHTHYPVNHEIPTLTAEVNATIDIRSRVGQLESAFKYKSWNRMTEALEGVETMDHLNKILGHFKAREGQEFLSMINEASSSQGWAGEYQEFSENSLANFTSESTDVPANSSIASSPTTDSDATSSSLEMLNSPNFTRILSTDS